MKNYIIFVNNKWKKNPFLNISVIAMNKEKSNLVGRCSYDGKE